MTTVAVADAVLSALTTAGVNAFEPHTAPSDADPAYAVVHGDLGRGETYRLSGRTKMSAHRFVVMAVGITPHEARFVADEIRTALEGQRIAVSASPPLLRLESSRPVELDDTDVPNVYSGSLVFTFATERA